MFMFKQRMKMIRMKSKNGEDEEQRDGFSNRILYGLVCEKI